jgi:hypothetical protein
MTEPALNIDDQLTEAMESFIYDPLGFVLYAYPWGEDILIGEDGPDEWQEEELRRIGELVKAQGEGKPWKDDTCEYTGEGPIQIAIKAGRDPGKTALIAWIIHWFASTRPHPQGVVTANTATQLDTKTWRELAKWHGMSVHSHWFHWTATKFYLKAHPKTWFMSAIPWSKDRPQAFAGTHEKYVLMVFDESSTIDDIIWETAEGGLTDPFCLWIVVGNPTKTTGRLKECWGKFRHRWFKSTVDARSAKRPNKTKIQQWIDDYGEDHDFVRIWVKGIFPRASIMQLIPEDLVEAAMKKTLVERDYGYREKIMGIDIARQGNAMSVIQKRQGLAAFKPTKMRIPDNMIVAGKIAQEIDEWKPDAVFIDQGAGVGVIDRLRQMGYIIIEVPFGSTADDSEHYYNKRTEIWFRVLDWLKQGGALPEDDELKTDLTAPEYGFGGKKGLMQLVSKDDIDAPLDCGDALALTFAYRVVQKLNKDFASMKPKVKRMDVFKRMRGEE